MRIAPVLLLAAALAAADEAPPPTLSLSAPGGMVMSMSPERPSEAPGGWRLRYEEVRLEGWRLLYRLAPYAGGAKPMLLSAEFSGAPDGPPDGRVLFDSSASKLPQAAFRGVMHPRKVVIQRQPPDPAAPGEVHFDAEITDLGDVHGLLRTDQGERQLIAWADRASLRYVAPLAPGSAMGIGVLRLTDMHFYGRGPAAGGEARPAVVLRMTKPVADEEATVERQLPAKAYGLLVSGQVISILFDAAGKAEEFKGDYFENPSGEGFSGGGASRPKLAP